MSGELSVRRPSRRRPRSRSVLVLADPARREALAALLHARGHEVVAFAGTTQAWRALQPPLPDFLVIDEALPAGDAASLCRRFRQLPSAQWSVVLLLADPGSDDGGSWLDAGVNDVIHGPLDGEPARLRLDVAERLSQELSKRRDSEERLAMLERVIDVAPIQGRRRKAEGLRFLLKAVETMQLGVTITDLQGTILYTNPADANLHGYRPEELVGKDIGLFVPGGKRQPLTRERIKEMSSWRRESVNARRDGSLLPVQLLSDVVTDVDGEPIGIITTCEDITDRKAAQAALQESRANLAAILENTRDAVWSLDGALTLLFFNSSFADLCRALWARAPQVGQAWEELVPEAQWPEWRALYRRALAGEPFIDERSATVQGGTRAHEVSFNPIRGVGGVTGVCVFARDVTDRRAVEEALRESEERYAAARGANDGLWDWNVRTHHVYYSPRWKAMLGYDDDEIGNDLEDWLSRVHPEDRDHLWSELTSHIDGRGPQFEDEHRIRHKDGSWRWMLTRGVAVHDDQGRVLRMAGSQIDVTERRQAVEALRVSEQRYALAARGANDGLWDWDLRAEAIYLSPRFRAMVGLPDPPGDSPEEWFGRVHEDDIARLREDIRRHLEGLTDHLESEYRMRHADGSYRWMLCRGLAVRDYVGRPIRIAGSQTDITDRKRVEEQLLHDAFHDSLTGLPNRALFMDRLNVAIARSRRREAHRFAVLFIDIDRFKLVNDGLGHLQGDRLLQVFTERLKPVVRTVDTLARLGGDEFTLLLDGIATEADATSVAERIQSELQAPFDLGGQEVYATASIGIALGWHGYTRPEDVVRDADTAMFRAKAQGRARHKLFDAEMHARAVSMLQLETDLRRALERREQLELHYQPLVDLATGRVAGFEALARWLHPSRGMIPPAHFIPLAEETGLVLPLGRWALEEACREAQRWRALLASGRPLTVSVNLSGRQFSQRDLVAQVRAAVRAAGLDPRLLRLEITESILMDSMDAVSAMLTELRGDGIQVNIDDFGTGFSSLAYLPRFPIDAIKIDRSFVSRMLEHRGDLEVVRTILHLARSLGMQAMAEGIETAEQLAKLRELGCEYGQGYYFARPLAVRDTEALLATDPAW